MYGPIFVRLTLGGYFVLAGRLKLQDPNGFVEEVKKFGVVKESIATLYGVLLPYLEIGAGTLLLVGFYTTLAAIITSLLLVSYVIALRLFPNGGKLFNKDIVLLGSSLSLLWTGAGAFSLDFFRKPDP